MKKGLKYLVLKRYLDLLFILLALLLLGLFTYKFYQNIYYFGKEKYKAVEMVFDSIENSIKEKEDAISFLHKSAENGLKHSPSSCSFLEKNLKQSSDKKYFALDKEEQNGYVNITGFGNFKVDNEMCMAYELSSLFYEVGMHIKESAWIYYTSKKNYIVLFPYVDSKNFYLKKEDMKKECFLYGTPAINRDRALYWSPLYVDAAGLGLMVSVGKPVYYEDEFMGIVALDMTLNHLAELTSKLDELGGTAVIINAQHQVLAASNIKDFSQKSILKDNQLLSKESLEAAYSDGSFTELDGKLIYKKRFENAPWELIYIFQKEQLEFFVLQKMLPLSLVFLFMLIGRLMVHKVLSTQKELEALNNSLEKKVNQKVAELEIQKSKYETFFRKVGVGMCLLQESKIVDCNDMVVEMLAASSKEDVIGHYILAYSPKMQPDGSNSLRKARQMQQNLIKYGEYSFEWQFRRVNGELFWADISSNITYIDGQKVVQVVWKDIDERKKLQQSNEDQMHQLIHQSRLAQLGEMLSMISHQWRQPLSSIAMVANNLEIKIASGRLSRSDEEENQKSDAYILARLQRINKYVEYLSNTIDDFKNFYRPQKKRSFFNINALIDGTIELIAPTLEAKNITIYKNYAPHQELYSFENEIKQVILNILNNAKDALVESQIVDPTIMIKVDYHDSRCLIEIEDNGLGIDEKYIDKIFDPYFSTKSKNGTGLGLYMSRTIIEEHCHGKLSVENGEKGACFKVVLPVVKRELVVIDKEVAVV
jgi:PAS domain S-box-containing protein